MGKTEALRSRASVFPTLKNLIMRNINTTNISPPCRRHGQAKLVYILNESGHMSGLHMVYYISLVSSSQLQTKAYGAIKCKKNAP